MKKNLILVFICLVIGIYIGYIMFSSYKNEEIKPVSIESKIQKLYFVQVGVYSNLEQMKDKLSNFSNYIYIKDDNLYHAYIAITGIKENSDKLTGYFKKNGYDIYVKQIDLENQRFNEVLKQYDELLKQTSDEKAIETICNQILNQYKELVMNVESKTNT